MPYTEIKKQGEKKYYYRVKSVREGHKIKKVRKYLGADLSGRRLTEAEEHADRELIFLRNVLNDTEVAFLDEVRKNFSRQPKENVENRYEVFCAQFTYDSNAIEGNTLTLRETAYLLFESIVPAKSLREIHEALNHKNALDFLLRYKENITKKLICALHALVVKDTLKPSLTKEIGRYRSVQVYIRGVEIIPPKPKEVAQEMKLLLAWYSLNKKKVHPFVVAAYFHIVFEAIHPFVDGNGRVGRLLMNFILHKNGFPMINIPHARRIEYYNALHAAQSQQNFRPFVELLLDILNKKEMMF